MLLDRFFMWEISPVIQLCFKFSSFQEQFSPHPYFMPSWAMFHVSQMEFRGKLVSWHQASEILSKFHQYLWCVYSNHIGSASERSTNTIYTVSVESLETLSYSSKWQTVSKLLAATVYIISVLGLALNFVSQYISRLFFFKTISNTWRASVVWQVNSLCTEWDETLTAFLQSVSDIPWYFYY